jgi:hypothetical protein
MRVTNNTSAQISTDNLIARSSKELAAFISVSPEQHRKIAELICSISDRMGKEGVLLLQDFIQAVTKGTLEEFSKHWAEKKVPMSIMSDLLAISQEVEANTREKVDDLILKAKRGAIQLGKQSLARALVLAL